MPEEIATRIETMVLAVVNPDAIGIEDLGRVLHAFDEIFGERIGQGYGEDGRIVLSTRRAVRA